MDLVEGSTVCGGGHLQNEAQGSRPKIVVSTDGRGVVGRAGTDLADATGLTTGVSEAGLSETGA
jgi:hypothetical protein